MGGGGGGGVKWYFLYHDYFLNPRKHLEIKTNSIWGGGTPITKVLHIFIKNNNFIKVFYKLVKM